MKVISVVLLVFMFVSKCLSNKKITFNVSHNNEGLFYCNSSADYLDVQRKETIEVNVHTLEGHDLKNRRCFLINERNNGNIIESSSFVNIDGILGAQVKADTLKTGRWKCNFQIPYIRDENQRCNDMEVYPCVSCTVFVNVLDPAVIDTNAIYYIIAGGVLAAILVISQTIVIIYLKRKSAKSSTLPHLQRTPTFERDNARYSVGPGQRNNTRRRDQEDLYQAIEDYEDPVPKSPPPTDIANRPPLPLPIDMDDEKEYIDADSDPVRKSPPPTNIANRPPLPLPIDVHGDKDHIGKASDGNSLRRNVSPEPPPLSTLPRKGMKFQGPKPVPKPAPKPAPLQSRKAADVEMEHYDYAQSDDLIPATPLNRGALFVNELASKFASERKRNIAGPKKPIAEISPRTQPNWHNSANIKMEDRIPPDARAMTGFRPPPGWKPTQSSLHEPGRPHEPRSLERRLHKPRPFDPRPLKPITPDARPQETSFLNPRPQGNRGPQPMGKIPPPQTNVLRPPPPPPTDLPPKPGSFKKPLPIVLQSDELYEPIEGDEANESTDDEEFVEEELEPFNMYINSVSLLNRTLK